MPYRNSSMVLEGGGETGDTDGDSPPQSQRSDRLRHRRTSRACDQCRKTKTRCDHSGDGSMPCRSCLLSGYECTFFEPSQKRGPPKGYLSALESRLHEAEALLGVIISSDDMRAKTLVFDLSKDSLANTIIKRVTNSVFGPVGREELRGRGNGGCNELPGLKHPTDSRRQQMNCREVALMGDDDNLVFTVPSNTWQDYLSNRLATEATYSCENCSGRTMTSSTSTTLNSDLVESSSFRYIVSGTNGHKESLSADTSSESCAMSPTEGNTSSRHSSFSGLVVNGGDLPISTVPSGSEHWYPDLNSILGSCTVEEKVPSLQNYFPQAAALGNSFPYHDAQNSVPQNLRKDTGRSQDFTSTEHHTPQSHSILATQLQAAAWPAPLTPRVG